MNKYLLSLFAALMIAATGISQISISLTKFAKENFNGIGSSPTAALPAGWKMSSAGTGFTSVYATGTNVTTTTQAANIGTPTTGGRYNWATSGNTDRAAGFMSDGAYADGNAVFADYINNTGATITNITVSYNAERYRTNTGTASVALFRSTDGSTWTAVPTGDISSGVFAPGASAYEFVSPQTVYKTATITGLNITNSTGHFYLRWVFTTGGTSSQGLGLDDVAVFAQTGAPVISGSMRDNLQVDNNSNGLADGGDQIRYTTVIRNTGTADANGVSLANQTPNYTTLNPGSVKTSSLARDDNYSTPLNTPLTGATVLGNDIGIPLPNSVTFFGPASAATTAANGTNTAKSDNGATVLMNANGTFTYTPVNGFNGIDRFSYIATNGNAPDNAGFVTVTVGSSAITPGPAESYNVVGNISITTPGTLVAGNLLFNDGGTGILIGSVNAGVANVGTPIITANGGNLTVNSNGSFTYNPAPGYEGPDSFTYTIDNGFSSPGAAITVSLTISGSLWFIDNTYAGAVSDGRLGTPFKTLAAFQAVNTGTGNNPAAGDNIFLYTGAGDYTGGITLLSNQKLIGAGATASLETIAGLTLPSFSATLPPTSQIAPGLSNAAGVSSITLNSASTGNTLRGFEIKNATGSALSGNSFGTLTVSEVAINTTGQALSFSAGTVNGNFSSVSSGAGSNNMYFFGCAGTLTIGGGTCTGGIGTALVITNGTINITTNQAISQANPFALLSITGHSTGTITFQTGTISATNGTGLQFDNADGTYNFNGLTTLSGGDAGIDILNGSAGGFTFGAGTAITGPSGTAFNISNSTAGVTYSGNITKNNAGSMVSLLNHSGGTVTFQTGTLNASTASTGNGLQFDNADGTYNFNGTTILNGGDAGIDILNGSGGNFIFVNAPITNPTGAAFVVTGGNGVIAHTGAISKTSSGRLIDIQSRTAGSVTINSNLSSTSSCTGLNVSSCTGGTVTFAGSIKTMNTPAITPVTLATNTGATINFTGGGLVITSTTSNGFNATGGGTIGVSGTGNIITSTSGIALNVTSTNIGSGTGLTFQSISANGASSGINLSSTGALGSLIVTGTGSAGSGGTVQNSTGDGVVITSSLSPNLSYMNINDNAGGAVDDGIVLTNITGSVVFANLSISGSPHNAITFDNNNTNLTSFVMTNSTLACPPGFPCQPSGSIGNDGILITMRGSSIMTSGSITGCTFSGLRAVGAQIQANDAARIGSASGGVITGPAASNSFTIQSNTFTGNGQGIDMGISQVSNMAFQVLSNTINAKVTAPGAISNQASSTAINAFTAAGADTGPASHYFVGKIDGNVIGTLGTKDSGSGFGNGIRGVIQGANTQGILLISNNIIREVPNAVIINLFGQNGAGTSGTNTAHFKVINNTMPAPSGSNLSLCGPVNTACAAQGIFVLADEGTPVCNVITGNVVPDLTPFNGDYGIYLAERTGPPAGAQLTVEGTGGSNSTYIQANNTIAGALKFIDEGGNTSQIAPNSCGSFPALLPPTTTEASFRVVQQQKPGIMSIKKVIPLRKTGDKWKAL